MLSSCFNLRLLKCFARVRISGPTGIMLIFHKLESFSKRSPTNTVRSYVRPSQAFKWFWKHVTKAKKLKKILKVWIMEKHFIWIKWTCYFLSKTVFYLWQFFIKIIYNAGNKPNFQSPAVPTHTHLSKGRQSEAAVALCCAPLHHDPCRATAYVSLKACRLMISLVFTVEKMRMWKIVS